MIFAKFVRKKAYESFDTFKDVLRALRADWWTGAFWTSRRARTHANTFASRE